MKRIILMLIGVAMCLPVAAQERSRLWNDSFNAGVSYSTNVLNEKTMNYRGVSLNFGYRKFLYYGLFVMPEASIYWQKYDCFSELNAATPPGIMHSAPKEKSKLNRVGLGIDALLGIRISMAEKVGIDLMAGPYIGWSFVNKEEHYFDEDYDNFEIRGRFGVGISVLDKVYVNAFYDVGKKKFINEGNFYHNNRGNIVTVGVGYTF